MSSASAGTFTQTSNPTVFASSATYSQAMPCPSACDGRVGSVRSPQVRTVLLFVCAQSMKRATPKRLTRSRNGVVKVCVGLSYIFMPLGVTCGRMSLTSVSPLPTGLPAVRCVFVKRTAKYQLPSAPALSVTSAVVRLVAGS